MIGKLCIATLACMTMGETSWAQRPTTHPLHAGVMPPGAIGSQRLLRGGPLSNYTQPTEIRVPKGAHVSLAHQGNFADAGPGDPVVGLLVGPVYRLRVSEIPFREGQVVYPTIELIDRLYPPQGQALRFPVPIELTAQELDMALEGKFVTRVIYVEDPMDAYPHPEVGGQAWFEAADGEDPLEVADQLGRPIAILRMGGRDPGPAASDPRFTYGSPPVVEYRRIMPEDE